MDSPSKILARHSAEILQSMKNARVRRDSCEINPPREEVSERSDKSNHFNNTCQLANCMVCEKDTPFWLLTRNPTWSSIMRVVFYALMRMFPEKQFFSLRTDVYRFVVNHWTKICVSKKRSENWKKQLQDTLSHNKKLFASGYLTYKQNGYWGLKQIIDPWAVSDYIEEEEENQDTEYTELRAMKMEILGDLLRLEERIAEMREGVEQATVVAHHSDMLLEEVRGQAEAEIYAIGEEVRKMYEDSVVEAGVIASAAKRLWNNTVSSHLYSYPTTVPIEPQTMYVHTNQEEIISPVILSNNNNYISATVQTNPAIM